MPVTRIHDGGSPTAALSRPLMLRTHAPTVACSRRGVGRVTCATDAATVAAKVAATVAAVGCRNAPNVI